MRGILLINKPKGLSSYDVIRRIKKITGIKKIGHGGTLDPLATGLLIILFNEATRIFPIISSYPKTYRAKIRLGITTDTDDITGNILKSTTPREYKREEILEVLKRYEGAIKQIPPRFSALKEKGLPLYQKARRGEEVSPKIRTVQVFKIELLSFGPEEIEIRTTVGKGTYIRSLARDIGKELSGGGTLQELTREKIGEFSVDESLKLSDLTKEAIRENIIPIQEALALLPKLVLRAGEEKRLLAGQMILPSDVKGKIPTEGKVLLLSSTSGDILFLARMKNSRIIPERLLYADKEKAGCGDKRF